MSGYSSTPKIESLMWTIWKGDISSDHLALVLYYEETGYEDIDCLVLTDLGVKKCIRDPRYDSFDLESNLARWKR